MSSGHHDFLSGGSGDDVIQSFGNGYDTMMGGDGNDTLLASGGHNMLNGGSGDNFLQGGTGSDTLIGGGGTDTLVAGSGHELMVGGTGSTLMIAGGGDDTMIGGSGHDTFQFSSNGGQNVVMGFHDGDMLSIERNMNGLDIHDANDVAQHVQDVHGSAVITLGDETITLVGIRAEDIHNNPTAYFSIH